MNGAKLLIENLRKQDVSRIYGIPGEENIMLMDELSRSGIQFVNVRHEQAAAFMADVHGRLTGHPGVCLATLGPGATNLATGVVDAYLDKAPLVAIIAQKELGDQHQEAHQYLNTISIYRAMTKWSVQIKRVHTIAEIVQKAFHIAKEHPAGPVLIEIPEEILEETVKLQPSRHYRDPHGIHPPLAPEDVLHEAANHIDKAKNPVLLVGNGTIRQDAVNTLRQFVEETNIPAFHTFMAKGVLPADHPLTLHSIGLRSGEHALKLADDIDLYICAGYDYIEYAPEFWNPHCQPIVHLDLTPPEADAYYPVCTDVRGSLSHTFEQLSTKITRRPIPEFVPAIQQYQQSLRSIDTDRLTTVHLLRELEPYMDARTVVISDVGAHKLWIGRLLNTDHANQVIISNGSATMGISLPGAIAAQLAYPDRRIVSLGGDGGLMMNVAELATAAELRLPIVVIVLADQSYNIIAQNMQKHFGGSFGTQFVNPDLGKLAESFGAKTYHISKASELSPTLADVFAEQHFAFVQVDVTDIENDRLVTGDL